MIGAFLSDQTTTAQLFFHPVLQQSVAWLQQNAHTAQIGNVTIEPPDWYANVHTYTTRKEPNCIWESHENTIDIQYVIDGEERIRWAPTSLLGQAIARAEAADRIEWKTPKYYAGMVHMVPGMAALFLPGEAHCPMIAVDTPILIRKAVVKIPFYLLQVGDS